MRLKFWRWAHDRAEKMWHWIYYNRLPEGIAQRKEAEIRRYKAAQYQYSITYVTKTGETIPN